MNRRSAMLLAIGLGLFASGCAAGKGCGRGGACSNCIPPWVPVCKYSQCVDDLIVWETGKNCGMRALARYRLQSRAPISSDFAAGFIRAHIDLAEGRGPLPPTLPPSRYWMAYYRSCAGQPCVEEWYAGYRVGLDEGLNGGVSQFRRIEPHLNGCQ